MTNSSQNVTGSSSITNTSISSTGGFDKFDIVQLMCFPIISTAGLIGNVLICLAVFKRRHLRITDVFILNLAATDLGTCVISIPFDFAEILAKQWPFGNVLCKTVYPLQTILIAVSVYTLLFMSWERHRSVMPPFKPKLKAKRALAILLFLWIACISLVGPFIAILRVETENGKTKCSEKWPENYYPKVFTLTVFIVLYVLPLFVITSNYIRISQKLWRDIQRMRKAIEGENKANVKKRLTQARAQRNMRIVKIFVIVVIAFSLCMLPNHIVWIWHDFGSGENHQRLFGTIIVFCYILMYANSAINPFIFVFLHRRYCKDIFSSCNPLKSLASCFKTDETSEKMNNGPRLHRFSTGKAHRKKKRAPHTIQPGLTPHDIHAARKEFWNNYCRKELIAKYEARRFDRVFQLSKNGRTNSRLCKVVEEDKNNSDDDNLAPQATRKVRVNFGQVVHIDEQRFLQPEGEPVM